MVIDELLQEDVERLKATDELEKEYEKQAEEEYKTAYRLARIALAAFILNYGKDGKLTRDAYKYGRFDKLVKTVNEGISKIKSDNPRTVQAYLKKQYAENVQRSAYAMESKYGKKLGIKPPKEVDTLTELSRVSLKSNKVILKNNVRKALSQAVAQEEGINGVSSRIRKTLEKNINSVLATTRTETTRAANEASISAMAKASKTIPMKKRWVAVLDDRTRASHARIDGEVRNVGERFSNGLMYPGDPAGPPEQIMNCRCRLEDVVEGFKTKEAYQGIEGVDPSVIFDTYETWTKNRL